MDKLIKVGRWITRHAARLVLGVLVLVLAYRVYEVVHQAPETSAPLPMPPRDLAKGTKVPGLPVPPGPPPDTTVLAKNYKALIVRNPFWVWSSLGESKDAGKGGEEQVKGIELLGIQKLPSGGYTAWIKTQGSQWYKAGDKFESYILNSIDPKNKTVVVYSEKLGRAVTLKMQQQQ